ncbi:MAG: helix-turn-helix domain-containing protein [Mycoplasmoidaceae bacterium]|nr:helix-turn-helix domain-containing protein [Mycoplasmoidaceae bacterium]
MSTPNYTFKISLKACRVNADLKQKELAEELGVCRATVVNWEKGETSPTSVQLQKISKITGIPIDFIILPSILQ